jgi:hypothetical protein
MPKTHTILVWFTGPVVVCNLASAALAQTDSGGPIALDNAEQTAASADVRKVAENALNRGASSSATFGALANSIQIETGGDDTTANVSFALNRSHPLGQGKPQPDGSTRFRFATDSIGISATAPLGKNGKPSLFDFDNFGDDTSLTISLSRYVGAVDYLRASNPASLPAIQGRLVNRCIEQRSANWVRFSASGDPQKEAVARLVAAELRTKIDRMAIERNAGPEFAVSQIAKKSDDEKLKALAGQIVKDCVENDGVEVSPAQLLADYGTDEDKAAIAASVNGGLRNGGPTGLTFFGMRGKFSRTNYEFLTQEPLAKSDISRTNYKIEAFAGRVFDGGRKSLTTSFAYVRSHKANDEGQLCEPNGVGNQLACFTGPIGPPNRTSRYSLGGEFRWLIALEKLPSSPSIGLAPRVSYEFRSEGALFELPIYFAPNKDKALNGGIRMAYDTSKDDFAFGLFVGVPFSVFTN